MIDSTSSAAVLILIFFVAAVIALSFWLARRAKSAHSYLAAGVAIHRTVNGIAFAGDSLSAASFLGICGIIATFGYESAISPAG